MLKKIVVSILVVAIFGVIAWVYLGNNQAPKNETVIEIEDSVEQPPEEDNGREHPVAAGEGGSGAFTYRDRSSWGEPTGIDSDGNPTGYRRVMPDGNVRTVSPFHGEPTTNSHPLHFDPLPINAQYKHWHKGSAADPLPVVSCVDGQWEKAVNKYVSVWNQSPFVHMMLQPYSGQGSGGIDCFDEFPGMIVITNFDFRAEWNEEDNEFAGYAFGEHDPDGHMLSVVIVLNDGKDWLAPQISTPAEMDAWKDVTVCHEIGHALGLGHNDENKDTVTGTCMDYARTPFSNLNPDAHDFEHIAQAYDHTHERMGVSCKLGEMRGPVAGSPIFYGVVAADNFFETPFAPERKTTGEWVVVTRWNGLVAEFGNHVQIAQSKSSVLFDQEKYFFTDQTIEYGFGVINPGPDHTYFEAFSSEQEVQRMLDEEIEQNMTIGLIEDCMEWKVHLPDLLWDTSLQYHLSNSAALAAAEQKMKEDRREE